VRSRTTASVADVFAECLAARGLTTQRLTAWTAWETFADFAHVAIGASETPDGDALLYQWGTFTTTGRAQFCLVLSRQVALDVVEIVGMGRAGAATVYEQFDCRLRYEVDPTLTALGRFESSWLQDGETALTGWVAQISGRPEWAVLAPLRPFAVELTSERL
jgi:hypothetical protein